MAVMNTKGNSPYPPQPPVVAVPDEFKGVVVDSLTRPVSTLERAVEGSDWPVDLYIPVLGKHDQVQEYQLGIQSPYQQYILIRGFVLRVTTGLSSSQVTDTKGFTKEGEANVFSIVRPNVGTIIKGDIGDGIEMLFNVTEVTRSTVYETSISTINYRAMYRNNHEIESDLASKVTSTYYFDMDYLSKGRNPLLTSEVVELNRDLRQLYHTLANLYCKDNFSRVSRTFYVPDQSNIVYDPHMVKFIKATVDRSANPILDELLVLSTEVNVNSDPETVLDALLALDEHLYGRCVRQLGLVGKGAFYNAPRLNGVYFSRAQSVVYPITPSTSVDRQYHGSQHSVSAQLSPGGSRIDGLQRIAQDAVSLTYKGVDLFPSVSLAPYILSEGFYLGDLDEMTHLDRQCYNAIHHVTIDSQVVQQLAEAVTQLDNVARFYYIPLVLLLIKIHRRGY